MHARIGGAHTGGTVPSRAGLGLGYVSMDDPKARRSSSGKQYDFRYFARKHGFPAAKARMILKQAGRSREKANELAERSRPDLPEFP